MGSWFDTSLEAEAARLDAAGYTCFLESQRGLWALGDGCWVPQFEFRQWSNVVCARRARPDLLAALDALVVG